jgi:hypothetical protein
MSEPSEKALQLAREFHCRYCGGDGYKCQSDMQIDAQIIQDELIEPMETLQKENERLKARVEEELGYYLKALARGDQFLREKKKND